MTPRFEDLIPLADFIAETYPSSHPIKVVIELPKEEKILDRINEDYFYRLYPNSNKEEIPTNISEVEAKINGISFKYVEV